MFEGRPAGEEVTEHQRVPILEPLEHLREAAALRAPVPVDMTVEAVLQQAVLRLSRDRDYVSTRTAAPRSAERTIASSAAIVAIISACAMG